MKEITLIEVGITNQDLLTQVENKKSMTNDLVANELDLIYKCKVKIIPYVMTWEGLVTKYHKKHISEILNIEMKYLSMHLITSPEEDFGKHFI